LENTLEGANIEPIERNPDDVDFIDSDAADADDDFASSTLTLIAGVLIFQLG
jgi:hypothetical protein